GQMLGGEFTNSYCADIILDVSFSARESAQVAIKAIGCVAFRLSRVRKQGREILKEFTNIFALLQTSRRQDCISAFGGVKVWWSLIGDGSEPEASHNCR